jgi:uncharacterized protein (TIGR02646 family)
MKFIVKTVEPDFFKEDTKELREKIKTAPKKSEIWDEYTEKRKLKEYILENEQNGLCCYCESKVTLNDSHVEHIKPKSLDYDNLTFEYSNLAVSCNGKCHTDGNTPVTCGHKKDDDFHHTNFLNPTIVPNIRDYFVYTDKGFIGASSIDAEKSKYTLELLQLNTFGNNLPEARLKALEEFKGSVKKHTEQTKKEIKEVATSLLCKENLAFISFLRFKYKHLLQGESA